MWQRGKIVLVMLLWASCYPLLALGIPYAQHLTFATLRALLAGLSLICLALLLKRPFPTGRKNWASLLGIALGATTLGFWGMFHAAEFVSPGIATVITNTQPIMAAFLAHFALNEKLNIQGKIGIFIAFTGIILIAAPQLLTNNTSGFSLGLFYIFMAAIGITVSNVLIRSSANKMDGLWAMGLQLLLGSIPLGILAAYQPHFLQINWSIPFIFSVLTLSLLGTAFVYWLWFNVLTTVELNQANIYSFLVPIFGISLGVIFYSEQFGLPLFFGTVLTILGIGLVNWVHTPPYTYAGNTVATFDKQLKETNGHS